LNMLEEIGSVENVPAFVEKIKTKEGGVNCLCFWCVLFWGGKSFFCFFAARGKRGVIIKRELEKIY